VLTEYCKNTQIKKSEFMIESIESVYITRLS
jgi:hypothetical protein